MAATKHVTFETPPNYPELLEAVVQIVGNTLVQHGQDKPLAQLIALDVSEQIRQDLGGTTLYLSKGLLFELSQRDMVIWGKFNGRNYHELAKEFKLTEVQIRNVINKVKAAERAKRQLSLPGLGGG